jgi:amidase
LRVPAQWNGVMALKATPGRIPSSESGLSLAAMTSFGPFARSVEDLRLGYGALAREDARDPWGVNGPERVEAPRAVIVLDPPDADPGVRAAIRAAAKALEAAGYELRDDDVPPGLDDMPDLWARLFLTEVQALWDELGPLLGADCRQWLQDAFVARPPLTTSGGVIEAYRERHALAAAWPAMLVLAPVMTSGAPPVGFDLQGPEALERLFRRARYCWAPNVLGRPAVAAKGVQLIGPRFGEALCLDAAGAL